MSPQAITPPSLSTVPILTQTVASTIATSTAIKLQSPTVTSTMTPLSAAPLTVLLQQKGNNMIK